MYLQGKCLSFFKILQSLLLLKMLFASADTKDHDLRWVVKGINERLHGKPYLLVGERWKIDCRMNDNTTNATLWQRHIWKKPFHTQRFVNKRLKIIGKNVFLISNLRVTDQGKYYCMASGNKKNITKYTGGIYVNKGVAFAKATIIKKPSGRKSNYGSDVTLSCEVQGSYRNYEMDWFKIISGQKLLLPSTDKSSFSKNGATQRNVLKISKLMKKDEGTYMCQIRRRVVQYIAYATVDIIMEEPRPNNTLSIRTRKIYADTSSEKVDQAALWRFGTIVMGTLFVVALLFSYRERRWRKKYIQALKFEGTNI